MANADIAREGWGVSSSEGTTAATSPSLGRSNLSTKAAPRRGEVPYSVTAEQRLLGMILLDEWECWGEEVETIVSADDFFLPEHQAIWRAVRWLFERGDAVTMPTVAHALEEMGVIDACDKWIGAPYTEPYLVVMMMQEFSAIGSASIARMVKHYADMRAPLNPRRTREIAID